MKGLELKNLKYLEGFQFFFFIFSKNALLVLGKICYCKQGKMLASKLGTSGHGECDFYGLFVYHIILP